MYKMDEEKVSVTYRLMIEDAIWLNESLFKMGKITKKMFERKERKYNKIKGLKDEK